MSCSTRLKYYQIPRGVPFLLVGTHIFITSELDILPRQKMAQNVWNCIQF